MTAEKAREKLEDIIERLELWQSQASDYINQEDEYTVTAAKRQLIRLLETVGRP